MTYFVVTFLCGVTCGDSLSLGMTYFVFEYILLLLASMFYTLFFRVRDRSKLPK